MKEDGGSILTATTRDKEPKDQKAVIDALVNKARAQDKSLVHRGPLK